MLHRPSVLILHQLSSVRLGREEQLMAGHAAALGIPLITGSEKMMERGRIDLPSGCLVMGTTPFVHHALRRLGKSLPEHTPYPEILAPWRHRKIWKTQKLRDVITQLEEGGPTVFVKPVLGWKKYTGFVMEAGSTHQLNGTSLSAPAWVSEPIEFLSEWRAYVLRGEIQSIRFADHGGDRSVLPDRNAIEAAVAALVAATHTPVGFVIDFGVTRAGHTALVEMNDGFSFGAYDGVDAKTYWDITAARWYELVETDPILGHN